MALFQLINIWIEGRNKIERHRVQRGYQLRRYSISGRSEFFDAQLMESSGSTTQHSVESSGSTTQHSVKSRFDNANFVGNARFDRAEFRGSAQFNSVHFAETVVFSGSVFRERASFSEATIGDESRVGPCEVADLDLSRIHVGKGVWVQCRVERLTPPTFIARTG